MTAGPMSNAPAAPPPVSKAALWTGRVFSGLVVLFMLMGAGMTLSASAQSVEGMIKMGYPATAGFGIGIALLISTALYALPSTAVLGAILLTGYLGGAVATHIRAGEGWGAAVPAFVFGALVWLGLLLRDRRRQALLPLTKA